jgi:hypothetical protein
MDPAKASIRAMKAAESTASSMARMESKLDLLLAALQLHDSACHADSGDDGPEAEKPALTFGDAIPSLNPLSDADLIPVRNRSHKKKDHPHE